MDIKNENVISEQQIQEWKSQYGKVFKSTINDSVIYWRKIRRKEYSAIIAETAADENATLTKNLKRQELIAVSCVLYPENIASLIEEEAGLATTIADEITYYSGFAMAITNEV